MGERQAGAYAGESGRGRVNPLRICYLNSFSGCRGTEPIPTVWRLVLLGDEGGRSWPGLCTTV